MSTYIVQKAWDRLYSDHVDIIKRSFTYIGINIAPDGSEDHKISIKEYPQPDFTNCIVIPTKPKDLDAEINEEDDEEKEFIESNDMTAERLALIADRALLIADEIDEIANE
jgi:hypothetical protein